MGRATQSKSEQMTYLKHRFRLLAHTAAALDATACGPEDLERILAMMDSLEVKIRRFRDDWTDGLTEK